jgi:stress response protein YsnF
MDDPLPRATRINDQYAKRYRLEQERLTVTWSSQVRFFEMEVLRHQIEATARWKDGTCDVEKNATAGAPEAVATDSVEGRDRSGAAQEW